jgi:predicted lipid-binding transport protein (Tim44 family)
MYLIVIGWLYVAVMMAVAEALHSGGSVLGAIVTLFLYGFVPVGLVIYLMGTPLRRKERQQQATQAPEPVAATADQPVDSAAPAADSGAPDAGGHAPGAAQAAGVAPMRKEP